MKSDMRQLAYEAKEQKEHIKDNAEKVKVTETSQLVQHINDEMNCS